MARLGNRPARDSAAYAEYRLGLAEARGRQASRDVERAYDKADLAQSKGWRTRWLREAARAEARLRRAERDIGRWQEELEEREEPEAAEYVLALDYEADAGFSSDVDIQIHIRREDRALMRESEARKVLGALHDSGGGSIPDGYEVAAIDWRNPHKRTDFVSRRTGIEGHLANFSAIIQVSDPKDWRYGGLKQ